MSDTAPTVPDEGFKLDAIVGLTMKVGNLADGLEAQRRRELQHRQALIPTDWPIVAVGNFPSSGNLALDLGSPPQGIVWLLRRLYVGAQVRSTAAAGTADLYVTAQAPLAISVNEPAGNIADTALALPSQAFYSNRQVPVHPPERLVVVIKGGTADQIYMAAGLVESYNERAMREVFDF